MFHHSSKGKGPLHSDAWAGALTTSHINERYPRRRASLYTRLSRPNIIICAVYSLYAFGVLFYFLIMPSILSTNDLLRSKTPAIKFPYPSLLLKLLACAWGVGQPVRYMIWPPTAPAWETLVQEDGNGVKRPKRKPPGGDRRGSIGAPWFVYTICEVGIILWCLEVLS